MKQRRCLQCNEPIEKEMRLGTDFCCDACRAKNWRKNNPKAKEKPKPKQETIVQTESAQAKVSSGVELASSLRGVIVQDVDPRSPKIDPPTHEKPQSQTQGGEPTLDELIAIAKQKCDELDRQNKKVAGEIANCDSQLKMLNGEIPKGGIPRILPMPQLGKNVSRTGIEMRRFHLKHQQGVLFNDWSREFFQLHDLEQRKKSQPQMQNEKPPQQENPPQEKIVEIKKQEEMKSFVPAKTSAKIISSIELMKKTYRILNLTGVWREFIGIPEVIFHGIVYGEPGHGKSTFCIKFAHYLAVNFGRVVYISAEEGLGKTLQDKLRRLDNNTQSPDLHFADLHSIDEIKKEIGKEDFHFIFIDSLDTLKINAARLKELREHYVNSAFVTISQSTKDGKMRGSLELAHDCDFEIRVADWIPVMGKNRFDPNGKKFKEFKDGDDEQENKGKPLEP